MDTTITAERERGRRQVAALGKLTIAALVGIAAVIVIGSAQSGQFDPQLVGFTVVALLCAGVVATGWRWALLLGTLLGSLMLAGYSRSSATSSAIPPNQASG